MFEISIRTNAKAVQASIGLFARAQVPFATAQGINQLAGDVIEAEQKQFAEHIDRPRPFTMKAFGLRKARKGSPTATVFLKDKTAEYLEPYELGGVNKLNSRALLKPKAVRLDQYGNIPRSWLKRIRANAQRYFVGAIRGRNGQMVSGVWERLPAAKGKASSAAPQPRLRLLVRFADAHPAHAVLHYRERAGQVVRANADRRLREALAKAVG